MLAATAMAADSPVDKGSLILGGSASFTSMGGNLYKEGGKSSSLILLAPSVGYFVSPGVELGAKIGFSSLSVGGSSLNTLSLGPEIGYYFPSGSNVEIKGSLYPYIKAFFLYSSQKADGWSKSITGTTFGGQGGINYMLSKAVALDAFASLQSDSKSAGDVSVSGTILMLGVGITAFTY